MFGVVSGGGVVGHRIKTGLTEEKSKNKWITHLESTDLDFKPSLVIVEYNPGAYIVTKEGSSLFTAEISNPSGGSTSEWFGGISIQDKNREFNGVKIYEDVIYMKNGKFSVVTAIGNTYGDSAKWAGARSPKTVRYWAIE